MKKGFPTQHPTPNIQHLTLNPLPSGAGTPEAIPEIAKNRLKLSHFRSPEHRIRR